ncbi:MAG: hypothetical protein AAF645_08380 [Myxococcota bacterium]
MHWVRSIALVALGHTGCGLVSVQEVRADGATDTGTDASTRDVGVDTGGFDDGASSIDASNDAIDAATNDMRDVAMDPLAESAITDGASDGLDAPLDSATDASADAGLGPCPRVDPTTEHLYLMNDLSDAAGGMNAVLIENGQLRSGDTACGSGWFDTNVGPSALAVPSSERMTLDEGSVDFLMWMPAGAPANVGILSRDARDLRRPGHVSIFLSAEDRIIARAQRDTGDTHVCANAAMPRGAWVHIGFNWSEGGVELWIDGERQDGEGLFTFDEFGGNCGTDMDRAFSVAGNDNPVVIGASAHRSDEGGAEPIRSGGNNLRFDFLRYSSAPRDFALWSTFEE